MSLKSQENGCGQATVELELLFLQKSKPEMRREALILRLMDAYRRLRFSLT